MISSLEISECIPSRDSRPTFRSETGRKPLRLPDHTSERTKSARIFNYVSEQLRILLKYKLESFMVELFGAMSTRRSHFVASRVSLQRGIPSLLELACIWNHSNWDCISIITFCSPLSAKMNFSVFNEKLSLGTHIRSDQSEFSGKIVRSPHLVEYDMISANSAPVTVLLQCVYSKVDQTCKNRPSWADWAERNRTNRFIQMNR